MNWISTKEKLPGTKTDIYNVFLVYKIGNSHPDLAWWIISDKFYSFTIGNDVDQTYQPDFWCEIQFPNQPERSKREDSQKCEMRCSEHCGNTVRDK